MRLRLDRPTGWLVDVETEEVVAKVRRYPVPDQPNYAISIRRPDAAWENVCGSRGFETPAAALAYVEEVLALPGALEADRYGDAAFLELMEPVNERHGANRNFGVTLGDPGGSAQLDLGL